MMNLDNLTIPPELFYSKTTNEKTWKPKTLTKIPIQIVKDFKSKIGHTKRKFKVNGGHHGGPELGRIGKIKRKILRKKKTKTSGVLKEKKSENSMIDNNSSFRVRTKQEEREILKEIKAKEESIKKRLYNVDENLKKKTRARGSSFKFFKSKNSQDEASSSDESDDLVPEIRDFNVTIQAEIHEPPQESFEAFEDDVDPDLDGTTLVIESLLKNLAKTPRKEPESIETLDSLIGTLEGTAIEAPAKPKPKFMGLGENQLQIDAGQKKFGLVECKECGFSYNVRF
jgi:hypothetical protein